jgi:hypothetical protein
MHLSMHEKDVQMREAYNTKDENFNITSTEWYEVYQLVCSKPPIQSDYTVLDV